MAAVCGARGRLAALALLAAAVAALLPPCGAKRIGGGGSSSKDKGPQDKVDGVSVSKRTMDWVAERPYHATHASTAGDELRYFMRRDGGRAVIRDDKNVCEAQADIDDFELHNATDDGLQIAAGQQAYVYFVCGQFKSCDNLRCYMPAFMIVIIIACVAAIVVAVAAACYCKCKAKQRQSELQQPAVAPAPLQQQQAPSWDATQADATVA